MSVLEILSVSVSGGVFSLLLYENVKNAHGQDGFLLGNIEYTETKKVTDADHWVINKESVIKIRSIVPCPEQFYFYDPSGKINPQKISNFLGQTEMDVVGWYIYRPSRGNMRLMLREKIIHKQLSEFFKQPFSQFPCCILAADWSANKSTHSLSQTFVRYNNGYYDGIPLRITNLSDSMCTYKNNENYSDTLNTIIKSVKPSEKLRGHLLVQSVQEVLQNRVKDLLSEVAEKEKLLFKLESDVKHLNAIVKNKKDIVINMPVGNGLFEDAFDHKRPAREQLKLLTSEL